MTTFPGVILGRSARIPISAGNVKISRAVRHGNDKVNCFSLSSTTFFSSSKATARKTATALMKHHVILTWDNYMSFLLGVDSELETYFLVPEQ